MISKMFVSQTRRCQAEITRKTAGTHLAEQKTAAEQSTGEARGAQKTRGTVRETENIRAE